MTENKYLEKISHWARYIGPGASKRFKATSARINSATLKNLDVDRLKLDAGGDLLGNNFIRQNRINAMSTKATKEYIKGQAVNLGLGVAGVGVAGLGVTGLYTKKKFSEKND